MKCPLCNLEGRIVGTRYVLANDDTPDKATELFAEQDIKCVNKNCENFDKVFKTERIPMELG